MTDIIYSSAKSIAQAIQSKEVSSVEVADAHLRRIDEVNPNLNAVVKARLRARDGRSTRG